MADVPQGNATPSMERRERRRATPTDEPGSRPLRRMCQNSVHGGLANLIFPTCGSSGPLIGPRAPTECRIFSLTLSDCGRVILTQRLKYRVLTQPCSCARVSVVAVKRVGIWVLICGRVVIWRLLIIGRYILMMPQEPPLPLSLMRMGVFA